ncbi:MAG: FAD:protein FMN transferase [Anaerolineae bacterium]|nr:FAD:protein FMN transferase [Anaerolineae bacterium]
MKRLFHLAWRAMGCAVSVQLETDGDGHAILSAVPAQVESFEDRLSRFRPLSELMQFNAHAGDWVTVSAVLFANLSAAKHAARLTEGAFNPLVLPALIANGYDQTFDALATPETHRLVPAADWRGIELRPQTHEVRIPANSAVDLGGIAKGWAAERVAIDLATSGACLVNFGGDLVARGAPQDLPGWEMTIADPGKTVPLGSLWLQDASLVTSGVDFRRWTADDGTVHHHIIDPRTGCSAETDILTVSVHHPSAVSAEAYAKAVLLRGAENGLHWLDRRWDASGLVVRQDGAVLATALFSSRFLSHSDQRITL